jgi:hypothetical protein
LTGAFPSPEDSAELLQLAGSVTHNIQNVSPVVPKLLKLAVVIYTEVTVQASKL